MKDPKLKAEVKHSESKTAWNVCGKTLGGKYKIARVPYTVFTNLDLTEREMKEAKNIADFIAYCLNNSDKIIKS